jgi:general secretion pathway protein M
MRYWTRLQARERRIVLLGASVLGALLLWQWGLSPAIHTLQTVPAQQAQAQASLRLLQEWAAEATLLKQRPAAPMLNRSATLQALEAATRNTLGPEAKVQAAADSVTVTWNQVTPQALADWLGQTRQDAQLSPRALQSHRADPTITHLSGMAVLYGEGLSRP